MTTAKLILSKKGFDTENGGGPSPILPDGRMIPLPIPEPRLGVSSVTYDNLAHEGGTYSDLLARLGYRIAQDTAAHLDPDLVATVRHRDADWKGMFGQVDQAESHLTNEGVGAGSLFLYWGWYAQIGDNGSFQRSAGFSSFFGYLEVDYVLEVGRDSVPEFARHHPHFALQYPRQRNRVYVARRRLSWNLSKPGWGVFRFSPRLQLSGNYDLRSNWRLPGCFHPDEGCVLTYNTNRNLWGRRGDVIDLRIPARGQEFVCSLSGKVADWAHDLVDRQEVWTPLTELEMPTATEVPRDRAVSSTASQAPVREFQRAQPEKRPRTGMEKPILPPLPGERQVSYGDRLLWYQLALQLNGKRELMLTESEYVAAVCRHFPDAVVHNVQVYRNYFNGKHKSMGFRDASAMPIPVEFASPE